ncbi:MAG TPA: hypothetical protein VGZ51_03670, partial [Actinomycetota bacterium]|nr:hypothetical protein [Actinomycetota bacterium]
MPLPEARREDILLGMQRIAIVGPAGSGKSKLAHDVGEATALRVVYLDRLFWKPGWMVTPEAEWEAIQRRELEV